MKPVNLFTEAPFNPDKEFLELLVERPGLRLERIVSHGHRTPEGQWYDQPEDEWVVLLSGHATLTFDGNNEDVDMTPGTHVLVPAHTKHRVEWTEETCETVWLALHVEPEKT
ncbi:cupin domain-containing protein [Parendozoicomonas sp. Alg238-R29]|uniref:cupin domain-containing protein n=1 Tax=Parendozoicomonas sp. Alg238-R29 TaxID=2993446 RepID=UPI00248D8DC0|nr:cupin domain-containing protein [Parendozoicomonas sp. Alg238-R29]